MYQLLSKVNREQGVVETFREMLSIARDAARQYPEMNRFIWTVLPKPGQPIRTAFA